MLDIGCVDHRVEWVERSGWLHKDIAAVASFCIGVDLDAAGVEQMNALGYRAIRHDIMTGVGSLAFHAPFEVVVAGETIEHLPCPQRLLSVARDLLTPKGLLVITTPNPYALHRFRAGLRKSVWESVDHVVYVFPSGIAEMADRTGFTLELATTLDPPSAKQLLSTWQKSLRLSLVLSLRRRPMPLGRDSHKASLLDVVIAMLRPMDQAGETAVYLLRAGTTPDVL